MNSKNQEVEHIKNFLAAKVEGLRSKIGGYDNPIMHEMLKHSPHLQLDFIRMKGELTAYEDALLAINNFMPSEEALIQKTTPQKPKPHGNKGKGDHGSKSSE